MRRWIVGSGALVGVAAILPAALVLAGGLLPRDLEIEVEGHSKARPAELADTFQSYDGIVRWWAFANQEMGEDFEVQHLGGPTRGPGMEVGFAPRGGSTTETWTLVEATPLSTTYTVDFGVFTADRTITLRPEPAGTRLRWTEVAHVDSWAWRWGVRWFREGATENRETALRAAGDASDRPRR